MARQDDRIQVPVLLLQGTSDRVVPVDRSETLVMVLKAAGKTVQYIELDGGDHSLRRYAHRLTFFNAMERFLDQNLAPR